MTQTYWGGNSITNLSFDGTEVELNTHRYDTFVRPIFDIAGSKKVKPSDGLSIQKPSDCFQNNMIMRPFDHQ